MKSSAGLGRVAVLVACIGFMIRLLMPAFNVETLRLDA